MAVGKRLWEPSEEAKQAAELTRYAQWLSTSRGIAFGAPGPAAWESLWRWSVTELGPFWQSIRDYARLPIRDAGIPAPIGNRAMPGATFFPGATVNYAEAVLARRDEKTALIYRREDGLTRTMTYRELYELSSRARAGLVRLGVGRGDRVAGFVANTPETLAVFLACASLGGIWSSCAPEFGVGSVLDRFRQIEPKVLFACPGYVYGGKRHDRRDAVAEITRGLPTLTATVSMNASGDDPAPATTAFADFLGDGSAGIEFDAVPFDHPLWILYSSGTTGLPKPIVHGHGGILLEHWKSLALHCDLRESDRFFWFTTTGWMMWNFLIGGLLRGATIVLYDGSPAWPDLHALWKMAEELSITVFGTSAPWLLACQKAGIEPKKNGLASLRHIGSTGAPLPGDGFEWVYASVKKDVQLGSMSGGTDVCTAFVLANPWLPVHSGEIQCRGLGCKVEAFDATGKPVVGEVGELVITEPMPSMPLFFWGDADGKRMRESYFEAWPGVWRHGDWIELSDVGGSVISGRSDSTLNRGGVRMGTAEFYRVVEALPEIADSLVVDTGALGHEDKLWLFVVMRGGTALDDDARAGLKKTIREKLSPRHVPDEIVAVREVPRTLNGKKMEVPVKKLLMGVPIERALNRDTMTNPKAIDPFVALASRPS